VAGAAEDAIDPEGSAFALGWVRVSLLKLGRLSNGAGKFLQRDRHDSACDWRRSR